MDDLSVFDMFALALLGLVGTALALAWVRLVQDWLSYRKQDR